MKVYKINFKKLIFLLLPTFLRKKNLAGFIRDSLQPLSNLYGTFLTFRNRTLDELSCNSQKCHLQRYLNDKFDDLQRDIYIADMSTEPLFLYKREVNKAIPVYQKVKEEEQEEKTVLLRKSTMRFEDKGFIVHVPRDIMARQDIKDKLKACVEKFKLVTTFYETKSITRPGATVSDKECSDKHQQWHKCELPVRCKWQTESWEQHNHKEEFKCTHPLNLPNEKEKKKEKEGKNVFTCPYCRHEDKFKQEITDKCTYAKPN